MRVIYVHFDTTQDSVTVVPEAEVMFEDDKVTWQIVDGSEEITYAAVEFETGDDFFPQNPSNKHRKSQKLTGKKAWIEGKAPVSGNRQEFKYTVRGTRGAGKPAIELDPVIIVVPPV